jgi:PAS domain S-box-containing protein
MVEEWSDSSSRDDTAGNAAVRRRNARLKSEAFHNAILTSAKLAVVAIDADGIIQLFNVGAERMLGYTAAEVVNRITVVELHDEHDLIVRA